MFSKTINFLYFHRRRAAVTATFCGLYGATCYSALSWQNEVLRFGIAGSLANVTVEAMFHVFDTVNIRTKSLDQ
jgi:hypothetical protein